MAFDPTTAREFTPSGSDPTTARKFTPGGFDPATAEKVSTDLFSLEGFKSIIDRAPSLWEEQSQSAKVGRMAEETVIKEQEALKRAEKYPGTEWATSAAREAAESRSALTKERDRLQELQDANAASSPTQPSYPYKIAELSIANAPATVSTLGSLILARLGFPTAGAALGAGTLLHMGGQTSEQAKQKALAPTQTQGASQPLTTAQMSGFAQGMSEVATELLPLGKVLEYGKGPFAKWFKDYFAQDLVGEELNTVWQALVDRSVHNPNQPLAEFLPQLGQDLIDTAAVTAVQGGVVAGAAKVIGPRPEDTGGKSGEITDGKSPTLPPPDTAPPITTAPPAPPPAPPSGAIFTDTDAGIAELEPFIAETDAALARGERPDVPPPAEQPQPTPTAQPAPGVAPSLNAFELIPDAMMTGEVARHEGNFEDPNTGTERTGRRVTAAVGAGKIAEAAAQGLTFGQLDASYFDTSTGPAVFQLGEASGVRPQHYLNAILEEIYSLAQKYNPKAIYAILPEDVNSANEEIRKLGAHFKLDDIHFIIPRHATNLAESGSHISKQETTNAYNYNAKLQAGSTIWHEFGHSLLEDFIFSGLDQVEAFLLKKGFETGEISKEVMGKLAPEAQALIRRWQELRKAAMEGKISGHETAARFLSPAKVANARLMKEQFRLAERTQRGTVFPASRIVKPLEQANWFNFMEFAAEQMAKVYFEEGTLEKSKLTQAMFPEGFSAKGLEAGLQKFFAPILGVLKEIFNTLKVRGYVAPEAEFKAWLASLATGERDGEIFVTKKGEAKNVNDLTGDERAEYERFLDEMQLPPDESFEAAPKKKAGKKAAPKKRAAPKRKKAGVRTPSQMQKEIDWASKDVQSTLRAALVSLIKTGMLSASDPRYKELQKILKDGMFEEFVSEIEPLLEKKLKFDFVGEKAKGANLSLLRKAKQLSLKGVDPKKIWEATGWMLGKDYKWRFEISSKEARLITYPELSLFGVLAGQGNFPTLAEVLHHPKLFAAYPQLKDILVIRSPYMFFPGAAYHSGDNTIHVGPPMFFDGKIDLRANTSLFLHEAQHAIQKIEGFAPGGNSAQFLPKDHAEEVRILQDAVNSYTRSPIGTYALKYIADKLIQRYKLPEGSIDAEVLSLMVHGYLDSIVRFSPDKNIGLATIKAKEILGAAALLPRKEDRIQFATILSMAQGLSKLQQASNAAFDSYRRILGEYEARLTEGRMELTEEERRQQFPSIPDDFIIDWRARYTDLQGKELAAGTRVATSQGDPMPVLHSGEMQWTVDGAQVWVFSPNMLDANWVSSLKKETAYSGRLLPYYVRLAAPLEIDLQGAVLSPSRLTQAVREAKASGKDGVVVRGASGFQSPLFISFDRSANVPVPEANVPQTQLRFDLTTNEGEGLAGIWDTLKNKFTLEKAASAVHKLARSQFWALQLQQIAHVHPDWEFLKLWEEYRIKYYRKIASLHGVADAVTRQLAWTGKELTAKLYKFTLEEYTGLRHWTELVQVDRYHWEHRPTAELIDRIRKAGLDPDSRKGRRFLRLYIEAKNALQFQQDEMERVMLVLRGRKYSTNPERLKQELASVRTHFSVLRGHPFWPQQTFGENVIRVYRKDENGRYLIYEAATDSEVEARQLLKAAEQKYPNDEVLGRKRVQEEAMLMRLPVEFLDDVADALGLDVNDPGDKEKLTAVQELMQSIYSRVPGEVYGPEKALVKGEVKDFLQNFADFSLRNSNFIAKMEFRKYFDGAAAMAQSEIDADPFSSEGGDKAAAKQLMQDTVKYLMNPTEEMHQLRAIMAIGYLWANAKTAVLNLFGLLGTWATLNRELGYAKGTAMMAGAVAATGRTLGHEAYTWTADKLLNQSTKDAFTSVTDPNWEIVDGKKSELRLALEQAKSENVLDQTYAYYLAGQALRGDLMRAANRSVAGKAWKFTIDGGMAGFRATELGVRRASFIALYRMLQQTKPELSTEQRYEEAVRLVGLTQGDYTKGNRPRAMRGKLLSLITLFMTFVHNASWGAYRGMEMGFRRQEKLMGKPSPALYRSYTVQMVLLYLTLAGLTGLPFAENLLDILDGVFRKFNNGKTARMALQEFLKDTLGDDNYVRMAMHGATFNVAGMDWSRSIGLGRPVPGTDVLADQHRNSRDMLGDVAASVSGIAGGYGTWVVDTGLAFSEKLPAGMPLPTVLHQQMAKLPGGIGNMFKAHEWSQINMRGPSGGLLAHDLETGEVRELTDAEIALKAFGFQPSAASFGQEVKAAQDDARIYWEERRKGLYEAYDYAKRIAGDREALADVLDAVRRFNKEIPSRDLFISRSQLEDSSERREEAAKNAERLEPGKKMLRGVYQDVRETFGAE